MSLIIAIDFDGTIVEHEFPKIGKLKLNAKDVINSFYDAGHEIIIWTCRTGEYLKAAEEFLKVTGIKYHKVNQNSDKTDFKPIPKIYYDILIDDRNLGGIPDDWKKIEKIILHKNSI